MIPNLIGTLERQTELVREITKINHEKREALKVGRLDLLQDVNSREMKLVQQMSELERDRVNLSTLIAEKLSLEDTTVTGIAESLSSPEREKLINAAEVLRSGIDKLKLEMELNKRLADEALRYRDYLWEAWQSLVKKKSAVYGANMRFDGRF